MRKGDKNMGKFVEYGKMSKKEQKKLNAEKRNLWSASPVTKVVPNKKAYNRKKVSVECFSL
jgi:hypothetical protein